MSIIPRYEIRLSGSGGQGLILAGTILAEAIALHEQKYVVQSQSYGPEARGTASKADVIISDEAIDYPKSINPDVLLAMNQKALDINFLDLKKGGILIVDSGLVKELPTTHLVSLPLTQIALEVTQSSQPANMVALGVLAVCTQKVSLQALSRTLTTHLKKELLAVNQKALKAGARSAKKWFSENREKIGDI
jgi:2-oxoglutarate ferredoxin oxidoreductase subunit gamma